MAIQWLNRAYVKCTLESERSHTWVGLDIFCEENGGKWWRTDGVTFTDVTATEDIPTYIPPEQMGSGASISTKYLRGDNTWQTISGSGDLLAANNLSDVASASTSRVNLGISTTANQTDSTDKRFMSDAQESKLDAISGTNTGDQTITLTGNVTGTGTGSFATTIANGVVTEAMQLISDNTTNDVSTTKHGYAPKGTNTGTKYLRDDATWATVTASQPDIALSKLTSTVDQTITAGYSAVLGNRYTITSGTRITIGSLGRLKIS